MGHLIVSLSVTVGSLSRKYYTLDFGDAATNVCRELDSGF